MAQSTQDNAGHVEQNPTIALPHIKDEETIVSRLGKRSIVLVGLMGAGKSSIGKKLAQRLKLDFIDSDNAIEEAAGLTIPEIFSTYGEAYFRAGERRVIARILNNGPQILATGGGAFMNSETQQAIAEKGISIWLKADIDVLIKRVKRRADRPLLQGADPEAIMRGFIKERYPVYARARYTVESRDEPHETVMSTILNILAQELEPEIQPLPNGAASEVPPMIAPNQHPES